MLTNPKYTEKFSGNSIQKSWKYHSRSTVYKDILSYLTSTCLCESDIINTYKILQFYLGRNDDNSQVSPVPGRGTSLKLFPIYGSFQSRIHWPPLLSFTKNQ